jgi:hypothetical protein
MDEGGKKIQKRPLFWRGCGSVFAAYVTLSARRSRKRRKSRRRP